MELRVLRYYLAVVREENITRAAQILHVTQPTLSRQLSELEAELGVQLFERGKRKITLTESGMLLRRRAEEMIELADKTQSEFGSHDENLTGTVAIGAGETAATRAIPHLMRRFAERYPEVRFDLFTGTADMITERMDKGLLDIGLLMEPVEVEKYNFVRLPAQEVWGVIMRKDDPLAAKESFTPADLRTLPLLATRRLNTREGKAWFGGDIENLNIRCTHNLAGNAALLVEAGFGYCITIEGSVSHYNNICFRPLNPPVVSTSVLAWKKYQSVSPAVRKFIEEIKDAYQA